MMKNPTNREIEMFNVWRVDVIDSTNDINRIIGERYFDGIENAEAFTNKINAFFDDPDLPYLRIRATNPKKID